MIGEPVIVVGNPQGLLLTCTTGVVSAVGRATPPSGLPGITLHGMIQTDAAINPGSSGGPWFNALGQVIGVTASQKRDAENIAFGVPVATIRHTLPEMLDVERGQGIATGLQLQPVGPCRVTSVAADSPAAAARHPRGRRADEASMADRWPAGSTGASHCSGHKPGESLKFDMFVDGDAAMHTTLVLGDRPKPGRRGDPEGQYGLTAVPLDNAKAEATSLRVRAAW